MARLLSASQAVTARQRARLDARAAVTARLAGMPEWDRLAGEAVRASLPATIDELVEVALTTSRMAAAALKADPADVLGACLTGRAAVEQTTGTEEG